jgi:hypothetical protein
LAERGLYCLPTGRNLELTAKSLIFHGDFVMKIPMDSIVIEAKFGRFFPGSHVPPQGLEL